MRKSTPSIQTRLVSGLLISLIVLLLIQWLLVERSIEDLSAQYVAARLVHSSDLLVSAVSINGDTVAIDESRIDPVYTKPFSGYYYKIKIRQREYRSRSLWDESLPLPDLKAGKFKTRRIAGPDQQQLLLVSRAYTKQKTKILVAVAEDITDINRDIKALLKLHAVASLIVLLLLVFLQVLIIRKSLLPLDKTRRDLDKLESGSIEKLDENVPKEIHELVHEINVRIQAFQQRLLRSRRATGNLAHALKRPLTLLSQIAQNDQAINDADKQNMQQYIDDINHLIDRELSRARLAGTGIGGRNELCSETLALIKTLKVMYDEKGLRIRLKDCDSCYYSIDREDFHELLGNLLDNACKWASGEILVSLHIQPGEELLQITVEDDGPGIDAGKMQQIMKRGTRLDEQTAGHGLGMSIVKDIVDQYHGSINLQRSKALHGLRVTVVL